MLTEDKNQFLNGLINGVIKEYNTPHTLEIFQNEMNYSSDDYFDTLTELVLIGHISGVVLGNSRNLNGNIVKIIDFTPLDGLKEFNCKGGFVD